MEKNHAYYLGTGELTRMYTLRVAFLESMHTEFGTTNVERDFYIKNLSTDYDAAIAKGKAYAENEGAEFDESASFSLEEITRRNSAQVLAANEAEYAQRLAHDALRQKENITRINEGRWPFGKYALEPIEGTNESYVNYFLTSDVEEGDVVMELLLKTLAKEFPEVVAQIAKLAAMPKSNEEYVGKIKARQDFTATLIADYHFEGYYGTVYIQKFIDSASGDLLMYMGSAPVDVQLAEDVTFKATIKSHEEYDGENQTKIQRIKVAA